MESLLGFHPPHFSEEAAWLPGWLQPSTIREASNQGFQCPSGQGLEEIGCLQQNISTRENENMSDNSACKSFHLFLSGEDTSTMNLPSLSSNHEVRYHLHLSSIEESQNLSNPISTKSQPETFEPNQPLIIHHPDSKLTPDDNTHEPNHNPSPHKGNSGISNHGPLTSKGQNGKNHKANPKSRKVDITDAVELAVAASEALIIHELIKDEQNTQLSTASSVLEAAIRVKQARLEEIKENLEFEESDEVDFLSDLDELTMADAYEDVGLTVTGHGDVTGYESISFVKDSYTSENHASNAKHNCNEHETLEVDFVMESVEIGMHKKDVDYAELCTQNADLGCDVDPIFSCSVEQPEFCMNQVGLQKEGELASCQTILRSSLRSRASGCNEREENMTNTVPDRFQSRWFGGWTCKNEVAVTNNKHKKNIPELFANETSSLSESAPDMNSGIQKQDNTVSQSSVAFKDTHVTTTTINGNSPSDDVIISQSSLPPTVSQIDILCSVVPCSLTSDTNNLDNTKTVSPRITDFFHERTKHISGESCSIRRQVSSLKTYSMLSYPHYDPYLDKQPTKTPIVEFQDNIDAHNPTSKEDTEKKTNSPIAIDSEENPDTTVVPERNPKLLPTYVFRKVKSNIRSCLVPMRKRVRFSEPEICVKKQKTRVEKHRVMYNKTLLQDLKFLITGFSIKKHKEIENLILRNGGIVLEDIPSPSTSRGKRCHTCPVILCPKRLLTTKFLYGCAVNACILKLKWLFDSVNEGSILPPKKHLILKEHAASCGMIVGRPVSRGFKIFENIAIMLHGKHEFCTKMAKVIKHGGGLVFKTFHWLVKRVESNRVLVGAIVVEDENGISRQLKQCAVEQNIAVVSFDWIVKSLYAGRVVPSPEFKHKVTLEMSEEI